MTWSRHGISAVLVSALVGSLSGRAAAHPAACFPDRTVVTRATLYDSNGAFVGTALTGPGRLRDRRAGRPRGGRGRGPPIRWSEGVDRPGRLGRIHTRGNPDLSLAQRSGLVGPECARVARRWGCQERARRAAPECQDARNGKGRLRGAKVVLRRDERGAIDTATRTAAAQSAPPRPSLCPILGRRSGGGGTSPTRTSSHGSQQARWFSSPRPASH